MRLGFAVLLFGVLTLAGWPSASKLAATPANLAQTPPQFVARVTLADSSQVRRFVTLGLDLLELRSGDDLFFLTNEAQFAWLQASGWRVVRDETQTSLLPNTAPETFLGGYRTVAETRALLTQLAAQHPNLAEFFIYGQSWEKQTSTDANPPRGHDLFGLKLTNKSKAGPKPTFLLTAAIHARELATTEIALRLADYMLSHYGLDGDVTWLLDEHLIVIVPVLNPDGRLIAEQGYYQRKNTNTSYGTACDMPATIANQIGVDLNRNFPFRWGSVNTASEPFCGQTFPGSQAASEPETQGWQQLARSLFADQRGPNDTDAARADASGISVTLHSYGNLVLWPWGWTTAAPPNGTELELIGKRLAAYNGYTPQQAIHLYPTSGTTDDWSYGELGIASFTFEVGLSFGRCGGFFPPFDCLDADAEGSFWARNLPALLYAARIARAPYQLANGPAIQSLTATLTATGDVELRAICDETANGNQPIRAAELYLDVPPWRGGQSLVLQAADGAFDQPVETAAAKISANYARSLFFARAQDALGNWGPVKAVYLSRALPSPRTRPSRPSRAAR